MTGVLEETTSREIDREHIVRRVDDWESRIDELYRQIAEWLPADWAADRGGTLQMHEEMMQRFGVPARALPVLLLSYQGQLSARIEPRGLWIIGTNGRLDFFSGSRQYLITDSAENFKPPDWRIAPVWDRRRLQPLNPDTFVSAL